MKIRKLLKKKFIILFATSFSGLFLNNFAEATVLNNSYKEVIDNVWQIVYRDFLDSSGKFQKSNWINIRREVLSKMIHHLKRIVFVGSNFILDLLDPSKFVSWIKIGSLLMEDKS